MYFDTRLYLVINFLKDAWQTWKQRKQQRQVDDVTLE